MFTHKIRFPDAVTDDVLMTHFTMQFWKKTPHNWDRNFFSKLLILVEQVFWFAPDHIALLGSIIHSLLLYLKAAHSFDGRARLSETEQRILGNSNPLLFCLVSTRINEYCEHLNSSSLDSNTA